MKIVIFSGGVGAARFLYGMKHANLSNNIDVTIISNTGDDFDWYGLRVCPDIDTVIYHLTEQSGKFGWGIKDDTFNLLNKLSEAKLEDWFHIGDKDLITHLMRNQILNSGKSLSEATDYLVQFYGCSYKILPMSNQECPTTITTTSDETLSFQEYFAKRKYKDQVKAINYPNNHLVEPAPGVIQSIDAADIIFFPPSNPLLSIEPILQISSIKKAIIKSSSKKIAISPIINGKSIKGPLSKILSELGIENNIRGIGNYYANIADKFFIDESDKEDLNLLNDVDLQPEVANILLVDKKLSPKYTREILNRIID